MSVEKELKQRLNLQEGDEITFVKDKFDKYVKSNRIFISSENMPDFSKSEMNGYFIVKRQKGRTGMYTKYGEVVIPEDAHKCWVEFYCSSQYYHEAIFIERGGRVEVRSCDGKKVIVPRDYDEVTLTERFIGTTKNKYCLGAYSYEGKEILPSKFIICYSRNVGKEFILICEHEDHLYGVYSSKGEEIIPCEHKFIRYFENHQVFFVKKKDGTESVYSLSGAEIISCQADKLRWNTQANDSIFANGKFPNDFILATRNKIPVGLYYYTGQKVIVNPANYSKMYLEKEYILCIRNDGVTMDVYDFKGDQLFEYKP